MADSILSLEEIIERMLTIFRVKWETEKTKDFAATKAPLLVDEHFEFGNPAIIHQSDKVVIYPEEEDRVDFEGGITGLNGCCIYEEAVIHIRWYTKEHEQARGHRIINQMGEVIKRMLLRNKQLKLFGAGLIHGLELSPITYGEQIRDAYEGSRVFYPTGDMLVRVHYAEHLDEDPA